MAQTLKVEKKDLAYWGVDLNLKDRPAGLKEANSETVLSAQGKNDYDKIPRQHSTVEILVSTEHKRLPPVFGTSCPPKGLSGMVRRFAFRISEGKKTHWLILLLADRINVIESVLEGLLRGRPDNLFAEMGLSSEFRRGGFFSRFGHNRADIKRWGQQVMLAGGLVGAIVWVIRSNKRKAS